MGKLCDWPGQWPGKVDHLSLLLDRKRVEKEKKLPTPISRLAQPNGEVRFRAQTVARRRCSSRDGQAAPPDCCLRTKPLKRPKVLVRNTGLLGPKYEKVRFHGL